MRAFAALAGAPPLPIAAPIGPQPFGAGADGQTVIAASLTVPARSEVLSQQAGRASKGGGVVLAKCSHLAGTCRHFSTRPRVLTYDEAIVSECALYDPQRRLIPASSFFREHLDGGYKLLDGALTTSLNPAVLPVLADRGTFWLGALHAHFGHFLASTLPRLWAYPQAPHRPKVAYVGPQAVLKVGFVREILKALGLRESDFIWVPEGTLLRNVTIAEPAFIENSAAYAAYGDLMSRIGAALAPDATEGEGPPIYFSKERLTTGVSRIVNESELSQALVQLGVEIVFPETLSLADQARLWRSRKVFMANEGSQLHCAAFTRNRQIVSLAGQAQVNSNQPLIDLVGDHHSLYLYAPHNIERLGAGEGFQTRLLLHRPRDVAVALMQAVQVLGEDPAGRRMRPKSPASSAASHVFLDEPLGENLAARRSSPAPSTPAWQRWFGGLLEPGGSAPPPVSQPDDPEGRPSRRVDLGRICTLSEIRLIPAPNDAGERTFGLQISPDGVNWAQVGEFEWLMGPNLHAPFRWPAGGLFQTRFVVVQWADRSWGGPDGIEVFGFPEPRPS